jgi:predicted permease
MAPLASLSSLGRDLRHAARVLRRSPGFALTAIVILALVIGANTTVLTLADAVLLKPLPYPEPERLAYVAADLRAGGEQASFTSHDGATWEALRDGASAIDVAVTRDGSGVGVAANLLVDDVASSVGQMRVGAGYFRVLGVAPALGREFTADEDRVGGPAVAVLSHDLWQRLFAGDASAVGRSLLLRGEPYEIVGVMPRGFRPLSAGVDVWTPVRPSLTGEGSGTNYGVIARLRPGYTWSEALARMPALDDEYFRRRMGPNWADARPAGRFSLVPLQESLTAEAERPVATLVAAAAGVLLIACVNLAALLLARAGSRTREIATRMALGGDRGAVVRQLFAESLVLAALGGLLGLAVGYLGLRAFAAIGASAVYAAGIDVALDARALAATAGLALVTALTFGLWPALTTSRLDVNAALTEGGARGVAGSSSRWSRRLLVGGEVALGVVLLVVTGLLIRTFVNLRTLDPGFDATNVMTARVSLQDARYDTAAKVNALFDSSLQRLAATPGVESAAVSLELPYRRLLNTGFAFTDEASPTGPRITNLMYATPGLFATLRIPLRSGRTLADGDTATAPPVVVVSQGFVDALTGGESPVGRRIRLGPRELEIVGVVGDVRITGTGFRLEEDPLTTGPLVYLPAAQAGDGLMRVHASYSPSWTVRARDPAAAAAALRAAITGADPTLPVGSVQPITALRADATATQRLLMTLVGVLAAAALLLSATGIYGLVAHGIAERRRELGVRMALGATAPRIVRSVALSGIAVAAGGAVVGMALAWIAVRVLDSRAIFWGVGSHDPATFAGVAAFLLVVAALASVVPARKILELDPAKTLRE